MKAVSIDEKTHTNVAVTAAYMGISKKELIELLVSAVPGHELEKYNVAWTKHYFRTVIHAGLNITLNKERIIKAFPEFQTFYTKLDDIVGPEDVKEHIKKKSDEEIDKLKAQQDRINNLIQWLKEKGIDFNTLGIDARQKYYDEFLEIEDTICKN